MPFRTHLCYSHQVWHTNLRPYFMLTGLVFSILYDIYPFVLIPQKNNICLNIYMIPYKSVTHLGFYFQNIIEEPSVYHKQWAPVYLDYVVLDYNGKKHHIRVRKCSNWVYLLMVSNTLGGIWEYMKVWWSHLLRRTRIGSLISTSHCHCMHRHVAGLSILPENMCLLWMSTIGWLLDFIHW